MHCQVIYWDDHTCPPLVMKREGRGKKGTGPRAPAAAAVSAGRAGQPAPIQFTHNAKEKAHVED
jgi:hypothetical protein